MSIEVKMKTTGEMAAVYARYSSHNQGEQSIEGQLSEAKRYAADHGYTIVHEYIDRAKSGRTDNREEFQRMLKDTGKKQFSVIILWKVDRFGRNREEIAINKMKCRKNGVRVEYIAETIPDTPEGVILESVLEGFAEYYSLQLSQNIKRGMNESAEKCQSIGGTRPLGYKTGKDKRLEIDETTAPIVRKVFSMYAGGATITEIIRDLNKNGYRTIKGNPFTKNSLWRVLKNEKYIGVYNNNGKRIENGMPRIIDDDLFYKVQEMLKINKRAPARTWSRADYILSDRCFCGKCGAPMVGESGINKKGTKYSYYICSNRKHFHSCQKKANPQAELENAVIEAVCSILQDDDLIELIVENTWQYYLAYNASQEDLHGLEKQLEQTETAIKNLVRAAEAGFFSEETKARLDELTEQKTDIKAAIADLQIEKGFHLEKAHIEFFLHELRNRDYTDREVQKRLIQTFVNAVFVFDDYLKVCFNFTGDKNTVSLQTLNAADAGEVFGRCASCFTIYINIRTLLSFISSIPSGCWYGGARMNSKSASR